MANTTPPPVSKDPVFRPFLTLYEVADALGIVPFTAYRLCKSGKIKSVKLGNRYRIHIQDLAAFVGSLKSGAVV